MTGASRARRERGERGVTEREVDRESGDKRGRRDTRALK